MCIDRQELDRLDDEIARQAAHMAAGDYRLLVAIAAFDAIEGYADRGCRTMAHWLNFRIGCDMGAAREKVRVAKALAGLPKISAAFEQGRVSYSKVRAMTRMATADNEADLLNIALHGTAKHVERVVRGFRRVTADDAQRQEEQRFLSYRHDAQGMLIIEAKLLPDEGAAFLAALRAQKAKKNVDGFMGIVDDHRPQEAVEVTVHVDIEALRADTAATSASAAASASAATSARSDDETPVPTVDGTAICNATARRLCCDAGIVTMVHGADGEILNVGRKSRCVTTALRRALRVRDKTCTFPGCDNEHVDAHHIAHWLDGGETSLANMIQLCRTHHRMLHEFGFSVARDSNTGTLTFRDPQGRPLQIEPLPASEPAALQADNTAHGLTLDKETLATWEGHPVDYGYIVAGFCDDLDPRIVAAQKRFAATVA